MFSALRTNDYYVKSFLRAARESLVHKKIICAARKRLVHKRYSVLRTNVLYKKTFSPRFARKFSIDKHFALRNARNFIIQKCLSLRLARKLNAQTKVFLYAPTPHTPKPTRQTPNPTPHTHTTPSLLSAIAGPIVMSIVIFIISIALSAIRSFTCGF